VALLEREAQLYAIAGYLDEAADGHGRMVFVAGEAGIGKTTFVGQVLADAAGAARVATRTCDGSATPAPLGPLVEMLPQLPADIWPPDAMRQDVFARLIATLRQPRQREPYLLVIQDAHWGDEATLDLIHHVSVRILIISSRTEAKVQRWMAYRSMIPNQISTRLSRDPEVGVKWTWMGG
jgi:predicted ATPase